MQNKDFDGIVDKVVIMDIRNLTTQILLQDKYLLFIQNEFFFFTNRKKLLQGN